MPTEQDRYNEAYATGEYDPMIGLQYTRCLYRLKFFDEYKKILDVGCGTGASVMYHRVAGKEAYGIDFADNAKDTWERMQVTQWCSVASADNMPFKDNSFDLVACTDMMEHVPEEEIDNVLGEMLRVGSMDFFFTIALFPAKHKMPDGTEPHITLKTPYWWVEKMGKMGFRYYQVPFYNHTLMIYARKNESEYRRYKSLQQKVLYLPNERKIYTPRFPVRIHGA